MLKILFLCFTFLFLLGASDAVSQSRNVKEIKITSSFGWIGEEHYSEILIRHQKGVYKINEDKIEKHLVDKLLQAIAEPKVDSPKLENLGVTRQWLSENIDQDLNGYLKERLENALPTQRTLYYNSARDTEIVKRTLPSLFYIVASDYYPEIFIEITEFSGKKIRVFSDSQSLLSLPWKITQNGKSVETFNANISFSLSGLLPEKFANKRRLIGEDLRGELAKAVMDEIEDQWNLLEVEERSPAALDKLREVFDVHTAFIYEKEGNGFFTAKLWRKDLPKNFSILLELPYKNHTVQNIDIFKEKIENHKDLVFSVNWLKNHILKHPEEEFRLYFEDEFSFGSSLKKDFYEYISSPNKEDLIKQIKNNQEQISTIQVGGKYGFSEWLVLPDKRMVLFRYNYFRSLMNWNVEDFQSFDCDNKKCTGTVISSTGKIEAN